MTDRRSVVNSGADPAAIGSLPPLGEVPASMHAQVVRPARYGEPAVAFAPEVVEVPPIGPDEVLVAVMAAGIIHRCKGPGGFAAAARSCRIVARIAAQR